MAVRIALVTVTLGTVGPARALLTLAERLDRRRFAPHFMTLTPPTPGDSDQLDRLGVPHASINMTGPFDMRGVWQMAGLLRRWRIDLVHARLQRAGFYARLAALMAGRPPVLVNVVNMYGTHFRFQHGAVLGRPLLGAERATAGLVDRWVANSRAVAADLQEVAHIPGDKVSVVHNAVDTAAFDGISCETADETRRSLGIGRDEAVVGSVSRLVPLKRIELLIDAMALLRPQSRPAVLLVVGDGPCRPALEAQARRLGLRVVFAGDRSDVPRLLSIMDVLAFSSSTEGQPNAVLEAMAARVPVVAARIPGIDEVIVDHVTGLIVEAQPQAFAEALAALLDDPSRRAALGAAGRARAEERFSPELMVTSFDTIYTSMLAE